MPDSYTLAKHGPEYRGAGRGKIFDKRIERIFAGIHAVEDSCPHLHLECYGEELVPASVGQVAEDEPRLVIPPPVGQLALFSGDAAA